MSVTTQTLQPVNTPSGMYPALPVKKKDKIMPLPSPNPSESREDFLQRAMGNPVMNKEYPDNKQRYAVANSQWRRKGKKSEVMTEKNDDGESAKVFLAPKSNAGPYYPDKGTDHIWENSNIQDVHLFDTPGASDDFKKACSEIDKVMKEALKKC